MGALLYAAGVFTGAGLMILHHWEVNKAVSIERVKYQNRIKELEMERRANDCADAYRRGKNDGRRNSTVVSERTPKEAMP